MPQSDLCTNYAVVEVDCTNYAVVEVDCFLSLKWTVQTMLSLKWTNLWVVMPLHFAVRWFNVTIHLQEESCLLGYCAVGLL
jgi:hypothetical protein